MANYLGYKPSNEQLAGYSVNRPFWYYLPSWGRSFGENFGGNPYGNFYVKQTNQGYSSGAADYGAYTDNRPIPLRESAFNGTKAPGFADIFYHRIAIVPTSLVFGSIINSQTKDFEVWNAYLGTKTLDDIVETGFDEGMFFDEGTLPSDFYALEERVYEVQVTPDGPPTIEAYLTLNWESPISNIVISITGSRLFFLPIVYRSKVQENLEWLTDILVSYNGKEQRIQVRLVPRQQFEVEAYLDRTEMHRIENRIYDTRERVLAIPIWVEARKASAPVTEGDESVSVNTLYGDFRENSLALVWEHPSKYDVFVVTGITDTVLSLDRGLNDDYTDPWVMPVRTARVLRSPERLRTGYNSVLRIALEVIDNVALDVEASPIQYLSTDTYFERPEIASSEGASNAYDSRIDVVDNQSGLIETIAPWEGPKIEQAFQYIFEGLEEIWTFREWLHRRAGRCRPFYMPSFENDFKLVSEGTIGSTFEAVQNDFSLQLQQRDNIVFSMVDGSHLFRVITSAETLPNGNLEITLDSALNEGAQSIDEISFFGLKRLTFDNVSLVWFANNVVQTDLSITEIEP